MFVSHKYKLIYYEVPRTGSHSITRALTELDPESPTVAERKLNGSGAGYHHITDQQLLANPEYCFIAAHRNPFDRLWSIWKHRKRGGNPEIFKTTSWARYTEWACDPSVATEFAGAWVDAPILEFVDKDRVDYWLDFHRLESSWARLSEKIAIPLIPLKSLNASPDHGSMQNAYSESAGERVAQRFAKDFDYFGYNPRSWQPGAPIESPER
ncbi:MAG: hypothetical protein ACJAYC_003623 [Halieaceae bacterium]|jgi:hypothetical protein